MQERNYQINSRMFRMMHISQEQKAEINLCLFTLTIGWKQCMKHCVLSPLFSRVCALGYIILEYEGESCRAVSISKPGNKSFNGSKLLTQLQRIACHYTLSTLTTILVSFCQLVAWPFVLFLRGWGRRMGCFGR